MKQLGKRLGLDTTRGQILIGFVATMMLILTVMFSFIYTFLSKETKDSAMLYIEEIAEQAGGRLESLMNEINVLTLQMAMDERMQSILMSEYQGELATYEERMKLRKLLLDMTAYSDTIEEIELYSGQRAIYPLIDETIQTRVDQHVIREADRIDQAGALIWAGKDREQEQFLLAVRQIKLEKLNYANGGYLVIKVKPSFIQLATSNREQDQGAVMRLLQQDEVLQSTGELEGKLSEYYSFERSIKGTSWVLQMMVQKKLVLSDVYWLRNLLLLLLLISIGLVAIMSYYLAHVISSPVKSLIRVMQGSKHGAPRDNPIDYYNKEVNQLNITYNQMVKQIDYLIKSVYEKELLKSRSEIRALHSQINPHFLFNTLDAIYWDHIEKGEKELAHIVVQLADLFRYSIQQHHGDGFVSIKQELEQVERYTNLMKLRWQERLTMHIDREEELLTVKIPKLLIQPLVENAIVHGIEPMPDGGVVRVHLYRHRDRCVIQVKDNGIGMTAKQLEMLRQKLQQSNEATVQHSNRGIGLYTIHRLLKLHYGESFGLHIESKEQFGTSITLEIPLTLSTTQEAAR
ncbi:sensor histidine kinase [Paenibacillus camelliae]|uniref:sensor histidine kinase n=1 Tax=Paenibacillus camelliae TaxID=512410 RepID=UPI00203A6CE2|nr:sensor histidine kinase [Paenibacillus camelliae]MCM3634352.1 sensor histidine kinase [Paenibacillus camelliae]